MRDQTNFKTIHGILSKERFRALLVLRAECLKGFRTFFTDQGFIEATTASIVNIAGSCENPHASFPLEVYGNQAYLSQSAQLQLEPMVLRLKAKVFSQSNSFRAENYDDPDAPGRRLSEFTLIEAEMPYTSMPVQQAFHSLVSTIELLIKYAIETVLDRCSNQLEVLGGDPAWLARIVREPFRQLEYSEALTFIGAGVSPRDFGTKDERKILTRFGDVPTFIVGQPAQQKFFNIKRRPSGDSCYSADLLMPPLGECVGAGLREEDTGSLKANLNDSRLGEFLRERGLKPEESFRPYFEVLEQEQPTLRGGFGVGFERFIAALIGINDIFETLLDTRIATANLNGRTTNRK
jgi:asparaginyl-tRNA synthetase